MTVFIHQKVIKVIKYLDSSPKLIISFGLVSYVVHNCDAQSCAGVRRDRVTDAAQTNNAGGANTT